MSTGTDKSLAITLVRDTAVAGKKTTFKTVPLIGFTWEQFGGSREESSFRANHCTDPLKMYIKHPACKVKMHTLLRLSHMSDR